MKQNKKMKYNLVTMDEIYDLDKLETKNIELFEIANKYQLYRRSTKKLYLKIIYETLYFLSTYIAEKEAKKALR